MSQRNHPKKKTQSHKLSAGSISFPLAVFLLSPYLLGGFYEAFAALISLALMGWLCVVLIRQGQIRLERSLSLLALAVLAGSYALCSLWAVDRGLAPMGFIKFLPLPLFLIALHQLENEQRELLWDRLPWNGAFMTLLSLLMSRFDSLYDFVFEGRRIAGFFQYSNSFALFLLMGILPLLQKKKLHTKDVLCMAVLFLGILLSGSRMTMILLGLLAIVNLFLQKERLHRFLPLGLLLLLGGAGAVYGLITGDLESAARFLTMFSSSSTVNNRLLFATDALPLILKHPFGLGYLGYYYLQGSIQHGVYSALYIHNELLQFLLDVGWLPTLLLLGACLKSLLKLPPWKKVMLFLFLLHCLVDFDLQFVSLGFILVLLLDDGSGRSWSVKKLPACLSLAVLSLACLYLGLAAALENSGHYAAAAALYPGETRAQVRLLQETDTAESMAAKAEDILRFNTSAGIAWSARARAAMARGQWQEMMEYKQKALLLARYSREEYLDYIDMLAVAWDLCEKGQDTAGAEICRKALAAIPARMEAVEASTSRWGLLIEKQPNLSLPPEYGWVEELNEDSQP